MYLKPLAQEREIDLLVTKTGNVMLLHQGALDHDYSYVQYDPSLHALQFVTEDGEMQDLGMTVHEPLRAPLHNTREIFMIEVKGDRTLAAPYPLKFTMLTEGA